MLLRAWSRMDTAVYPVAKRSNRAWENTFDRFVEAAFLRNVNVKDIYALIQHKALSPLQKHACAADHIPLLPVSEVQMTSSESELVI